MDSTHPIEGDHMSVVIEKNTYKKENLDASVSNAWDWKMIGVAAGAVLGRFMIGLGGAVIAPALLTISTEFDSLQDMSWYGSAYYLPQAILQLFFAKLFTVCSVKRVYISSLLIFLTGSVVSASASSSIIFVLGRVFTGIGAAGVGVGTFSILTYCFSESQRSMVFAIGSASAAISNGIGPVLGGALTQNFGLTWRWCFWINVPLGGLVLFIAVVCLDMSAEYSQRPTKRTSCERLKHLDLLGNLLSLFAATCLLLSVKPIGGKKYPTKTAQVVTSVLAGISSVALLLQQKYRKEEGLIPKRIIRHRTVWTVCGLLLFLAAGMANHIFFLPSVLQIVHGLNPIASGVRIFAYTASMSVSTILTHKIHKSFNSGIILFLLGGTTFFAIAAGLITTFNIYSSLAQLIVYQILAGAGIGFCLISLQVCPEMVLNKNDVPQAQSVMQMLFILGSAISISATMSVFSSEAVKMAKSLNLQPKVLEEFLNHPTSVREILSEKNKPLVLEACNRAFQKCFRIAIAFSCIAFLFAVAVPWTGKRKEATEEATEEAMVSSAA